MANSAIRVDSAEDKDNSTLELLAQAYFALSDAINGSDVLTHDDDTTDYWVGITNQLAREIAKLRPTTAREWALKISIDAGDYMIGAPVMESLVEDAARELAA